MFILSVGFKPEDKPQVLAGTCIATPALLEDLLHKSTAFARNAAEEELKRRRTSAASASTSSAQGPAGQSCQSQDQGRY